MLGLLKYEPIAPEREISQTSEPLSESWKNAGEDASESSEYELVVGRRQIASWLFITIVLIGICSTLAYMAGKLHAPEPALIVAGLAPAPPAPALAKPAKSLPTGPLFAEPEPGKVYLQVGAVEKGMAGVLVEGLRTHGFESFAAPGLNYKFYRVLIGPLPDPESFVRAQAEIDSLDLSAFARKYQQ